MNMANIELREFAVEVCERLKVALPEVIVVQFGNYTESKIRNLRFQFLDEANQPVSMRLVDSQFNCTGPARGKVQWDPPGWRCRHLIYGQPIDRYYLLAFVFETERRLNAIRILLEDDGAELCQVSLLKDQKRQKFDAGGDDWDNYPLKLD